MKRSLSFACVVSMFLSGLTVAAPAFAVSASLTKADMGSNLVEVQYSRGHERRGYERRGNERYFNGHRGSRHQRPGWRRHNDAWFPPAAFIAGAIIGGIISNEMARPQPVYRGRVSLSEGHIRWCYNQYRSYRASDNTFQPYNGPRRECRSPYY